MLRRNYLLSPEVKYSARAAMKILEGTGISLEDAARAAVEKKRPLKRLTIEQAIDAFLREQLLNDARPATVEYYDRKLRFWADTLPPTLLLDEMKRSDLRDWLVNSTTNLATRSNRFRAIRALFRWARKQEPPLIIDDPTMDLSFPDSTRDREVKFFSVETTEAILKGAGDWVPAFACGFFAGIRPDEISGERKPWLDWAFFKFKERTIRIPPEVAKTGKPRIIEGLPFTLWAWLAPYRKDSGPIAPGLSKNMPTIAREAAGLTDWVDDGVRHTFATHLLNFTGDPGKLSIWMGWEGRVSLLRTRYAGLISKKQGRAYVALRP